MELFSTRKSPVNRSEAWGCLMMNLLVCPGMGTIVAGKRIGFVQLAGAGIGMALTLVGVFKLLGEFSMSAGQLNINSQTVFIALFGIGLFLIFWAWGIVSGISILRSAPR